VNIILHGAAPIVMIRGEALVDFLNSSKLQIINQGIESNICSGFRLEVIDITPGVFGLLESIKSWEVVVPHISVQLGPQMLSPPAPQFGLQTALLSETLINLVLSVRCFDLLGQNGHIMSILNFSNTVEGVSVIMSGILV